MTFWENRNVFVTGATGLLGSWLVKELIDRGADVVCLVRDWVPRSELVRSGDLERVRVVRGDLCDLELLRRTLNEYEVDSVFHLAAQTIVGTASRSVLSTFESNIRGTWLLLDACRSLGVAVERIIVASSDKAYGEQRNLPYYEDAPLIGRFPYDVSKSCADLIASSYHRSFGLPVCITRCGNLYGGGDLNWNRLVPGTIRSALRGDSPIIRSDGSYVRDYFYVRDAARGYLLLAEAIPGDGITGGAFNFSLEEPLSVLELANRLLELVGRSDLELTVLDEATREIEAQYLGCRKAREMLGWTPSWTLDEGLAETVDWYREFLGIPE